MESGKLVELVIYAMAEGTDKRKAGSEIPGSLVRLARFPEEVGLRSAGRFSGPWEDIRLALNERHRVRVVPGKRNPRATRRVLEATDWDGKEERTMQAAGYGIKPEELYGTLNRCSVSPEMPRFSENNKRALETTLLYHYRNGTFGELEDETGDAVYVDDLPKLANLVGKKVFWEFRPYIRTAAGAASGVDDYKLQIVELKDAVAEKEDD